MGLEFRFEQIQVHHPIDTPQLTESAEGQVGCIEDILAKGRLTPRDKMLQAEAILLSRWTHADDWRAYLDAPLIAHADAALNLKQNYDAVVAIREAGVPYAQIFRLMGYPIFDIDFSHHRKRMEHPIMDQSQLEEVKKSKDVLVTDVDFVTGRTLREVVDYLRRHGVNVRGAYIGLSKWLGLETEGFHIGEDTVDFDTFWTRTYSGLAHLRKILPYKRNIIPAGLRVYSVNPVLDENERLGGMVARRVARYLQELETKK